MKPLISAGPLLTSGLRIGSLMSVRVEVLKWIRVRFKSPKQYGILIKKGGLQNYPTSDGAMRGSGAFPLPYLEPSQGPCSSLSTP